MMTTPPDDQTWNRLSPWGIATRVIRTLPSLIPALIGLVFLGREVGPLFVIALGLVMSVLVGLVPWLTTRWRVTDDKLELHHGLLRRVTATARRDRIRSVDVTAGPIERALRLRKVQVGTGVGGDAAALVLDPITAALAEQLSRDLLHRTTIPVRSSADDAAVDDHAANPEEVLARLQPSWIRFAPFSISGLVIVAAAVGLGIRLVYETGFGEWGSRLAASWANRVFQTGAVVLIPAAVVLVIVLSTVGSILVYLVAFWGFRLVRRPDGSLHTSRGLISTVAATLERKRVRGVQLHEPVLMRIPGGALLRAVATGTNRNPTLLPPAPRNEAIRVADDILGGRGAIETALSPHGPAALRRRRTRSVLAAVVVAVPLVWLAVVLPGQWWWLPAVGAAVAVLTALPLAQIRYRNLGSAISPETVVLGDRSIGRTRTALEHDGVIGFVVSESFFQRRAGVLTLKLATAAGVFDAVDVTAARAAHLAYRIEPEIVRGVLTD